MTSKLTAKHVESLKFIRNCRPIAPRYRMVLECRGLVERYDLNDKVRLRATPAGKRLLAGFALRAMDAN